ncbi:MAG: Soluble cytochrome f, partial [Bacteroidota bacterium]
LTQFLLGSLTAQVWEVPTNESTVISFQTFDDDMVAQGRATFSNSCISCHGTPTQADFTPMSPPPGDVASVSFESQTDGTLLYKIKHGRGGMPSFQGGLADDEIWNVIAYIRSFHKSYKQPIPDLGGAIVPELKLSLSFDLNIDKLLVRVTDDKDSAFADANVTAYIKTYFGKYAMGHAVSDANGFAYFEMDPNIPADSIGNINVIAKANKGYSLGKIDGSVKAGTILQRHSVIEGRHLWSTDKMAPIWLKILFWATIVGVWGTIAFILMGVIRLRNIKN